VEEEWLFRRTGNIQDLIVYHGIHGKIGTCVWKVAENGMKMRYDTQQFWKEIRKELEENMRKDLGQSLESF
jgi:hypothetical protein